VIERIRNAEIREFRTTATPYKSGEKMAKPVLVKIDDSINLTAMEPLAIFEYVSPVLKYICRLGIIALACLSS